MLERCRLFLLIALGETILTTGTAITAASVTLMTLVTGTAALVGTIALAVANEEVIANPQEGASTILSVLLCGGPMLFLLGLGWYLWFVLQVKPRLPLIGSAVLVMAAVATLMAPRYFALILVGVILVALAIADMNEILYRPNSQEL